MSALAYNGQSNLNKKKQNALNKFVNNNYLNYNNITLDFRAIEHYCPNKNWFINLKPIPKKLIRIANN